LCIRKASRWWCGLYLLSRNGLLLPRLLL
jgi:hypothetical protein